MGNKMKSEHNLAIKKISLCSLDNFAFGPIKFIEEKEPEKERKEQSKDVPPKDKFYYVHTLFLLLGLMHFIPFSFFLTANGYWMYKFRNPDADITDTSKRTFLQTHFSPGNMIINNTFTPFVTLLSTFFGYKIKARCRVLGTLITMSICFITATMFVKIDTDGWQAQFFGITLCILAVVSCSNAVLAAGILTVLSRFPRTFMKSYLLGQGFGGICSATLQIISLAMGTSTEVSALLYFGAGSLLMSTTSILFYVSKYNTLYNYHLSTVEEDASRAVLSISEAKDLAKKIWAQITAIGFILLTVAPVFPNISSLVVSKYYGSGSVWTDKYFVPVVTYFFPDIMGLIGRIICAKVHKIFGGVPLCIFMMIRMVLVVSMIYLCNAQPRHHLPLVFDEDWEYALIQAISNVTAGYVLSMVYLDIAVLVTPDEKENAYLVMLLCISIISTLCVPIGCFSVEIL